MNGAPLSYLAHRAAHFFSQLRSWWRGECIVCGAPVSDSPATPSLEVGSRVFIDFGNETDTALWGGPGTVTKITSSWTAVVKRDKGDGYSRLYPRWMLKPDRSVASPGPATAG